MVCRTDGNKRPVARRASSLQVCGAHDEPHRTMEWGTSEIDRQTLLCYNEMASLAQRGDSPPASPRNISPLSIRAGSHRRAMPYTCQGNQTSLTSVCSPAGVAGSPSRSKTNTGAARAASGHVPATIRASHRIGVWRHVRRLLLLASHGSPQQPLPLPGSGGRRGTASATQPPPSRHVMGPAANCGIHARRMCRLRLGPLQWSTVSLVRMAVPAGTSRETAAFACGCSSASASASAAAVK